MGVIKMDNVLSDIKKDYIVNLLKQGKREDGRGFDDYRQIELETGVASKADGSALVKLGTNKVMAGVKLKLGEPFSDVPASGVLMTNTELRPMASPTFEKGPPSEDSVEVSRVVDRGIRESNCIDLDKLCIEEGEKVYGALFVISEPAERRLDVVENYPRLYKKMYFEYDNKKVMTYIMPKKTELVLPTTRYLNIIKQGYKDCKIDIKHLNLALSDIERII